MATQDRTCQQCGRQFENEIGRGKSRMYCDKVCASAASIARNVERESRFKKCRVEGCEKRANRVGAGLCETHYYRVRRHGSLDKVDRVKPGLLEQNGGGYLLVYAPSHPLRVGDSPRVYEHRKVFYDAHGEGPFECHVCARTVTWDDMHVDHLNDDVKDNRIENLAPACFACNTKRGQWKTVRRIRESRGLVFNGQKRTIGEWADVLGISSGALKWRLANGWSIERALTEPRGKFGPVSRGGVILPGLRLPDHAPSRFFAPSKLGSEK